MMLMVLPEQAQVMTDVRIESGMETAMMSDAPPAPEEQQDHRRGEQAASTASRITPLTARAHEDRLIASGWI